MKIEIPAGIEGKQQKIELIPENEMDLVKLGILSTRILTRFSFAKGPGGEILSAYIQKQDLLSCLLDFCCESANIKSETVYRVKTFEEIEAEGLSLDQETIHE